jgi:hypothetical protein
MSPKRTNGDPTEALLALFLEFAELVLSAVAKAWERRVD